MNLDEMKCFILSKDLASADSVNLYIFNKMLYLLPLNKKHSSHSNNIIVFLRLISSNELLELFTFMNIPLMSGFSILLPKQKRLEFLP